MINVHTDGGDSRLLSERITIPAPAPLSREVAAYLAASERVAEALREQARCIAALKALDSRFPLAVAL